MVELTIRHYSESFQHDMQINMIVKNHSSTQEPRLLYLLHGYSGDFHSWNRGTRIFSHLKKLNITYPLYVIMPSAYNTYYTDTFPTMHARTYIMKELPKFIKQFFPQCKHTQRHTNIAGLSMGGYGALANYFLYPKKFNQVASFAGAVDLTQRFIKMHYELDTKVTGVENKKFSNFKNTDMDLFHLATLVSEKERKSEKISLYCGTEDRLIDENRAFHAHLKSLGYTYSYEEQAEYEHNWDYWDLCLEQWLKKVFKKQQAKIT